MKGWIGLSSFSGEWGHFANLGSVNLRLGENLMELVVESFRINHSAGLLKFKGIDTPENAKKLSGAEILVPRLRAAPLREDEWYLTDLLGLNLIDQRGVFCGTVEGFVETSDLLLQIRIKSGGMSFVPFRSEFVGVPDLESRSLMLLESWLLEN